MDSVVSYIKKWMDRDITSKLVRCLSFLFTLISQEDGSTTILHDGIEPHWGEIRTLVLTLPSQFKPIPAFAFHLIKNLIL
jgi:hypothetical protein